MTKRYKTLKDRVWVKDCNIYTIIKLNCRKCMGKIYVIMNYIERGRVKVVTLSCSCVVEQKLKERNVTNE